MKTKERKYFDRNGDEVKQLECSICHLKIKPDIKPDKDKGWVICWDGSHDAWPLVNKNSHNGCSRSCARRFVLPARLKLKAEEELKEAIEVGDPIKLFEAFKEKERVQGIIHSG